jgi:hypothetical protein
MLFRRRIIAPATTEREVVVVRPKRPASLYAALGVATVCAVGLIGYMTYALYENGQEDAMAATMAPERNEGRAQRLATPTPQQRVNRPANTTIIVNPPPVIHVTPPAPNPPVVKPPEKTIIVEGAPQKTDEREEDPVKQTDEDLRDDSSGSAGEENSRPD